MKVRDLIEALQQANPDSDAVVEYDGDRYDIDEAKAENPASVLAEAVIYITK